MNFVSGGDKNDLAGIKFKFQAFVTETSCRIRLEKIEQGRNHRKPGIGTQLVDLVQQNHRCRTLSPGQKFGDSAGSRCSPTSCNATEFERARGRTHGYRADDGTTNNLAESYFSRFRRMQYGQVHKFGNLSAGSRSGLDREPSNQERRSVLVGRTAAKDGIFMKIALYSDLHLELGLWGAPALDVDVVILAGDVASHTHGLAWAADAFHRESPRCNCPATSMCSTRQLSSWRTRFVNH